MAPAADQLQDIIHAIACRAIRHDVRTPLGHVQTYMTFLREALKRRPVLESKIAGSTLIYTAIADIPKGAEDIDEKIKELEDTLVRQTSYSGSYARGIIKPLIEGPCDKLERDAALLKVSFDGLDQEASEFATRVLQNARVAKRRLNSLLTFFRDDYAQRGVAECRLRIEAENSARDVSPSSNYFMQTYKFSGDASIYGSVSLMQTLFQNIYQNTQKYGGSTENLSSTTRIQTAPFSDLAGRLPSFVEKPGNDNLWVRVDFMNNGPPLPIKNVNAVFRLGKKFAVNAVDVEESQGLGMAICFAVATIHKGLIVAERRQEGVCFRLMVPRLARDGYSDRQLLSIAEEMRIT